MMEREDANPLPQPTAAELAILRVLWQLGPSTVREVHENLRRKEPTGYTTALKLLQVMHAKGLVERDDSQRAHIYQPAVSKSVTQRQFVKDIVNRVFEGSASQLVLQALGEGAAASSSEIAKIKSLIERLEDREDAR